MQFQKNYISWSFDALFCIKNSRIFLKTEKQSKNVQNIIELANKVSSQSVEIYTNAQDAKDSVEKTLSKLDNVMGKIKDGKGSLLSKISKMVSVGGLSPKKKFLKILKIN